MKKNKHRILITLATVLCLTGLTACQQKVPQETAPAPTTMAVVAETEATKAPTEAAAEVQMDGGVLLLRVNPEIAIFYDENGTVTNVTAKNPDAIAVIKDYVGFEGKACKEVVAELVNEIGEAGYFVEEIDSERRQITIEIEKGSRLPDRNFLDDVVQEVRDCVTEKSWHSPLVVEGESDFGITDYVDTDYGPNNDGVTDYHDTDYGPNNDGVTDFGITDYRGTKAAAPTSAPVKSTAGYVDTDYGPGNDGITDYHDTDYGPNNDGVTDFGITDYRDTKAVAPVQGTTDYVDTDYGPGNDGITDYHDTDYGPNNDGITDYHDTDYGPNNDGITDYREPVTDYGVTDYRDGRSNYDGGSDYDD